VKIVSGCRNMQELFACKRLTAEPKSIGFSCTTDRTIKLEVFERHEDSVSSQVALLDMV
jgi:hypothetical protein